LEAEMTTVDIDKLEARLREADSWHGLPPEAFDLLREVRELRGIAEAAREQKTFPHTTPTGHTYTEPTDFKELSEWVMNRAQGSMECWDDAELPPDETPAMFTIAWNTAVRAREALELAKDWGCFGPGMTIDGFTAKHGNVSKAQMAQIVARALAGEGR
jgi:hypothetical protein